jgi:hypothetical protein
MDPTQPPVGTPRWQYAFTWRYGHLLLAMVGLALLGFGASGLTTTAISVTMLPLGIILLVLGVALPRLRGQFTAGPTGIGADMLRLDEVDPMRAIMSVPAAASLPAPLALAATALESPPANGSSGSATPVITIGDVWDAFDASAFRPVSAQAAGGTAYLQGPDGQRIKLPNQGFWDHGAASDELLAIIATWGIRPVASGRYPLPSRVHLDKNYGSAGGRYDPAER